MANLGASRACLRSKGVPIVPLECENVKMERGGLLVPEM